MVYTHFGEGEYDVTENNIRFLLGLNKTKHVMKEETIAHDITPETYLGYGRADRNRSQESVKENVAANYHFPAVLPLNDWALQGKWKITSEHVTAMEKEAAAKIHFHAKKVFVVLGNATDHPIAVKLLYNGEEVVNEKGIDVKNSSLLVTNHTLYSVLHFPNETSGILELSASQPGLEIYTFTFG